MRPTLAALAFSLAFALGLHNANARGDDGVLPKAADGHALNLDFETGDLRDWTVEGEGEAFRGQPIEGDTVNRRRGDMRSKHAGKFWVGTFERDGDAPQGTLTSAPFVLDRPYARFLLAGGSQENTRVEIVRGDSGEVVFKGSGTDSEELTPVAVDLSKHVGKPVFVRLVDRGSGGWGHINFDDFKLWSTKPPVPFRTNPPKPDAFLHAGLSPEEAAKAMTVPPGFKVTLFAGEPDVVQPIAFTVDDRGRLWVAEAYSYPVRVSEDKAKDRILIFEDVDGDGKFDRRTVFADKLNLVSGVEVGFGGVWVGSAPNLLFIPDKDGDDKPDGPPEIVLDGWGYEDTHETLNSFTWGPDGWLYGCHGVFTHSNVGKPGDALRTKINAGVWRFHPTRRVFEVFAEGTSNPWGVDFDANGDCFITACVIPHLYYLFPGGRYERQAGRHFDPLTYDDIKTIADHRHYVGANPHAANGRSDDAGGGHAHAGAMIYQGGAWPEEYRGSLFMNNIHGARLNRDLLVPEGSGFVGKHAPDFLLANDQWSQIVRILPGPDGQVYLIDWYDKNQCHHGDTNGHDRTNGRIFKVSYNKDSGDRRGIDPKASVRDLLKLLTHPNDWYVRHARRRLQEIWQTLDAKKPGYDDSNVHLFDEEMRELARNADPRVRLESIWTQYSVQGRFFIDGREADKDPHVRAWAVRLADWLARPDEAAKVLALAKNDPSPVVRLAIASKLAAIRSPFVTPPIVWQILEALAAHSEDARDHNIPLTLWYACSRLAAEDPARLLKLATNAKIPTLLSFTVRALATGTRKNLPMIVEALGNSETDADRLVILGATLEGLKGVRRGAMPDGWEATYDRLSKSRDDKVRLQADALALAFSDPRPLKTLRAVLAETKRDLNTRVQAFDALQNAGDPQLAAVLIDLIADPPFRSRAIRGLGRSFEPRTAAALLAAYPGLTPDERHDALTTLAGRPESAKALLDAVGAGKVPSKEVSADVVRLVRLHKNPALDALVGKVWGTARETTADKAQQIARYRAMLSAVNRPPDPELGRAVYARTCQQCHTLFGTGGQVGPDLTGSNRRDRDYVLSNVLDPSALIGKDYIAHVVSTSDGRVLTGLIKEETKDALTLQTANEPVVIPLSEIEARRPSDQSLMPEGQWDPLSPHEVRSLVAYLASPNQVNMLATPENVTGVFNGRDLAGWQGDPKLWSVENGEIVGKTAGLTRNAFLRSDLAAENFRLTLRIKLVDNNGNSGVQFRSQALPDGEMKGDQADVGEGWWGKLYEENGRGLLWPKSGEPHVKPGDWNRYEVVADGPKITTYINGKLCVDLDDPAGARRGIFAFQLHSGGPTEVHIKDIRLELDPKPRAVKN